MAYFLNTNIPEEERRNAAFQVVCSLREAINIAKRDPIPITYEKTLDLLAELDPVVYQPITSLLKSKNESDFVKLYKELAEIQSTVSEPVTPVDLINEELDKMEDILKKGADKKFVRKRVVDLKAAREFFMPRRVSEHKALNQDFYLAEREGYFSKKIYENDSFKDYRLDNSRLLRLRLLHPDNEEAILGSDLIYEQFDLKNNVVRFVHMQYKMWEDSTLYFSDERMMSQLEKLEGHLCKSGYCEGVAGIDDYRMPHCSGFLRPTNRLQAADSKLLTSGVHIPICFIQKLKEKEKKVNRRNSSGNSLSNKVFEELFHDNMLGSRWIPIEELESFYETKEIKSLMDTVRVHAQEFAIETDEEKYRMKK